MCGPTVSDFEGWTHTDSFQSFIVVIAFTPHFFLCFHTAAPDNKTEGTAGKQPRSKMMMKIQNPGRAMACIVVAIGLIFSMIDAAAGTESTVRRRRRRTTATVHMDAWVRGEHQVARAAEKKQQLPSSILVVEDTTTTATTIKKIAAAAEMVHDEEERYLQRMLQSHSMSMSMSMRMLRSRVDTEDKKQDDVAADHTEESEQSFGRLLETNSMSMSMNMNLSIIFPPIDFWWIRLVVGVHFVAIAIEDWKTLNGFQIEIGRSHTQKKIESNTLQTLHIHRGGRTSRRFALFLMVCFRMEFQH